MNAVPVRIALDESLVAPVPVAELIDAVHCPERLPPYMRKIRVPVQFTVAEHERSSVGGLEMLDYARGLLSRSVRAALQFQLYAGHNLSLHRVARAYHLRALAFFDECLAVTQRNLVTEET